MILDVTSLVFKTVSRVLWIKNGFSDIVIPLSPSPPYYIHFHYNTINSNFGFPVNRSIYSGSYGFRMWREGSRKRLYVKPERGPEASLWQNLDSTKTWKIKFHIWMKSNLLQLGNWTLVLLCWTKEAVCVWDWAVMWERHHLREANVVEVHCEVP